MPPSAYKDDLEAAHGRIRALEQENKQLEAKLAAKPVEASRDGIIVYQSVALFLLLVGVVVLVLTAVVGLRGAVSVLRVILPLLFPVLVFAWLRHTCGPNEVLVLSGRQHRGADGVMRGYRLVLAGRVWRIPLFERLQRLDITLQTFEFVATSQSEEGPPMEIAGNGALRVGREGLLLHHAVERFLGQDREAMAYCAREIVSSTLRKVVSETSAKKLQQDREWLVATLSAASREDLEKVGLVLELLEVQSVRIVS